MTLEFELPRGELQLHGILDVPNDPGKKKLPLVILLHGVLADSHYVLIEKQKNYFLRRGFYVLRMDFEGHGKSTGALKDMTIPGEVEDAELFLAFAHKLPFVSQVYLAGHSQGGVVASLVAARNSKDVAGLMLFAPAGIIEDEMRAGRMMGVTYDVENPPETITVGQQDFGRDYLVTGRKLNLYEDAAAYKGPVLILHGEKDPFVPVAYSRKYLHGYLNCQLNLILGCGHDFEGRESEWERHADSYLKKNCRNRWLNFFK